MGLGPYGEWAVSPMYTSDSCGSCARMALATVSPPTPESKMPMGASFMMLKPSRPLLGRAGRRARAEHAHGLPQVAVGCAQRVAHGLSVGAGRHDPDRDLDGSVCGGERLRGLVGGASGGGDDDALGAGAQLLVGGAHIDHEVAVDLAELHH